jgi:hypothetical protein
MARWDTGISISPLMSEGGGTPEPTAVPNSQPPDNPSKGTSMKLIESSTFKLYEI